MATNYPAALDNSTTIPVESANTKLSVNHITAHQNIQDAIEAIEAKVGIDGSADTDSLEYKLSDITSSDKAVPNVDGELTTPSLTLGSDATGDLFYRGSDGKVKRLGVGANGKILKVTTNLPAWEDEAVLDDASASVKGVVEIATAAEVDTGTGTGGTGAKIVISPDTLATSIYAGFTKNFGTGADGNLTYDGSTTILGMAPSASAYTLTRDIYANNLTVNAGVTINTGGYRIFVKGTLTLSNATTSIIQNNGGNGGNGANGASGTGGAGGTAGAAPAVNTVIAGIAGIAGGVGSSNGGGISPGNGTVGASTTNSIGVSGVAGAAGGQATGNGTVAGGTAGSAGTATASKTSVKTLGDAMSFYNVTGLLTGSAGTGSSGGGGASSATSASSGGGGGGSGGSGGMIYIFAYILAGTGTIKAVGGNGGNGGNGAAISGNSGGGGGGAGSGGAGGIIILGSASSTNPYTMTVSGGSAGTGGTGASIGSGVGSNGATGATGTTGASYFI